MTNKKPDFPPPLISAYRLRFLTVAFGAPDDNQTVDAIPDKFERQRCGARIAFEKERTRINRAPSEDVANKAATSFVVEAYRDIETYARVALRYPALVRNDPRLKETLLDPWFEDEGASS